MTEKQISDQQESVQPVTDIVKKEEFEFKNSFSKHIFENKYKHKGAETWPKLCKVLVENVCQDKMTEDEKSRLTNFMIDMKFLPGGRYIYYANRRKKYYNNCFLLKAEADTREDWGYLAWKATMCLMTGGGIGIDYSVYRPEGELLASTGGVSSGPIPIMRMVNEIGRNVRQGGSRRSAIYASLRWNHSDIVKFLEAKNWHKQYIGDVTHAELKGKDFDHNAPLDQTNISVNYDNEWLENYKKTGDPGEVFMKNVRQAMETGEPGFSFNFGDKETETLRNAPISGDSLVLTDYGYRKVEDILDQPIVLWTGIAYAPDVIFKKTNSNVDTLVVEMTGGRKITCDPMHEFFTFNNGTVKKVPARDLKAKDKLYTNLPIPEIKNEVRKDFYTLGYAFGDGSFPGGLDSERCEISIYEDSKIPCKQNFDDNLIYSASDKEENEEEKPEGDTELEKKRQERDRIYLKGRIFSGIDKDTFPMIKENENSASFIAGLFDADGSTEDAVGEAGGEKSTRIKLSASNLPLLDYTRRELERLGIRSHINVGSESGFKAGSKSWFLVIASDGVARFKEIIPCKRISVKTFDKGRASQVEVIKVSKGPSQDVYCCDVKREEHSFMCDGVIISNCCEVTSSDDSDCCNLGSLNFSEIESKEELREIVDLATKFLVCGTLHADLPYEKVAQVREKNRRLGLGIMGLHEWLLLKGYRYEMNDELRDWLETYKAQSDKTSFDFCTKLEISIPVANRSIAPTGSIGSLAVTTTGIEPIYAVAYKRRYLNPDNEWVYEFVIDNCAKKMIARGVDPKKIETAPDLAEDVERRIKFQAEMMEYVDQGISSTVNLPKWGSKNNNQDKIDHVAKIILKYCEKVRGLTFYPDCARFGQPLEMVDYEEAIKKEGTVFKEEFHDFCLLNGKSSCG